MARYTIQNYGSPRLNLEHGFLQYIREVQIKQTASDMNNNTRADPKKTLKERKSIRPDQLLYSAAGRKVISKNETESRKPLPTESVCFSTMLNIDWEAVDLANYLAEAQPYIKNALENPSNVPSRFMAEVANTIVNRAWEDSGYYATAATLCHIISEKEREQQADIVIPTYAFRTGLVDACHALMRDFAQMRSTKVEYWISFCYFVGEVYKLVRPAGEPLKAMGNLLIAIMNKLASPLCVNNFEEADLLCNLFHDCGRELTVNDPVNMDELVNSLRDSFIDSQTDKDIRGLLLPLIELYASDFNLSREAKSFYFQM